MRGDSFIELLQREWAVIAAAPWTFAVITIAMAALIFAVFKWYFSGRESDFKSRLELRDDEIADYKRKLSGATPDEAKARMDRLQAEVNALKPRYIGSDRRQLITAAAMGRPKGKLAVGHDLSCADCAGYKEELAAAFTSAGWAVFGPSLLGYAHAARCGLTVEVANSNSLTALEHAVVDALKAASIEFEMKSGPSHARARRTESMADVVINVTNRLPY